MKKKVWLEEVGEITLRKIRNAKRISLKVKQTGQVLVTMPFTASYGEALSFADSQKKWIQEIHEKVKTHQKEEVITSTQNNVYPFFTIQFNTWDENSLKVQFKPPVLSIFHPAYVTEDHLKIQGLLKETIGNILKMEAQRKLPQMVERLAKIHNFQYQKLSLRKSATRWGSCSSKKSINLSVYLMLLPDELIEYVILHELCHTLEMNHGPRFYAHMNRVTNGKTMELRRKIKEEGRKWNFLKQKTSLNE